MKSFESRLIERKAWQYEKRSKEQKKIEREKNLI